MKFIIKLSSRNSYSLAEKNKVFGSKDVEDIRISLNLLNLSNEVMSKNIEYEKNNDIELTYDYEEIQDLDAFKNENYIYLLVPNNYFKIDEIMERKYVETKEDDGKVTFVKTKYFHRKDLKHIVLKLLKQAKKKDHDIYHIEEEEE